MAVSGGVKFFEKNLGDVDRDDVSVLVTTGEASKEFPRDRKVFSKWTSIGSDDTTTETYEYRFDQAKTITRLLLIENNFKAFQVEYWNGATYVDFASVVTKEGSQSDVTETTNTKTTNYYEFASVSTLRVRITVDTTQTVDAEKTMQQFIVTTETGTFEAFPGLRHTFEYAGSRKEGARGRTTTTLFDQVYKGSFEFQSYLRDADIILMRDLWEGKKEFLVYPCGANEDQFNFLQNGNRLKDIYLVWFVGNFDPGYTRNVYTMGQNFTLNVEEVN